MSLRGIVRVDRDSKAHGDSEIGNRINGAGSNLESSRRSRSRAGHGNLHRGSIFLRRRKRRCEVIVILRDFVRHTTRTTNRAVEGHGRVIKINKNRINQVLITEKLIVNEIIGSKGKSGNSTTICGSKRHTDGKAEMVCHRARGNTFGSSKQRKVRDRSLRPSRFRILTHEGRPLVPDNAGRNEEVICIQIHIIVNGGKHSLQTHNLRGVDLDSITRQDFITKNRNQFTNVKRSFMRVRAIKNRTLDIYGRQLGKTGFNVTIHADTSLSEWSGAAGAGTRDILEIQSGEPAEASHSRTLLLNFARTSSGRASKARIL